MKKALLSTLAFLTFSCTGMSLAQLAPAPNPLQNIAAPISNWLNSLLKANTPTPQPTTDNTKVFQVKAGQTLTLLTNISSQEPTSVEVAPEGWNVQVDNRIGSRTLITFATPDNAAPNSYACVNSPVGPKKVARRICVFVNEQAGVEPGILEVTY